jgi:hypothetical protein
MKVKHQADAIRSCLFILCICKMYFSHIENRRVCTVLEKLYQTLSNTNEEVMLDSRSQQKVKDSEEIHFCTTYGVCEYLNNANLLTVLMSKSHSPRNDNGILLPGIFKCFFKKSLIFIYVVHF